MRVVPAIFILAMALTAPFAASAQQPSFGSTTTEATGTVAATGVYQLVFPAQPNGQRRGCLIQNTGANTLFVYFGLKQPTAASGVGFQIPMGLSISCGLIGSGLVIDNVWVTGTTGGTFEQASQP